MLRNIYFILIYMNSITWNKKQQCFAASLRARFGVISPLKSP